MSGVDATLVVDSSLGFDHVRGLTVVSRERSRHGWGPVDVDAALDALAALDAPIVLAASPDQDPEAGALSDMARTAGAELVLLPDDQASRAFVVAVGRSWAREGIRQISACLGTLSSALATGSDSQGMSGLGALSIARWARRAGVECNWCGVGRPVRRGPCARCGAVVP